MESLKFIHPGIQVRTGKRGKTIRYFASVCGRRHAEMSRIPYGVAVSRTNKPTKLLLDDYAAWIIGLQDAAPVANARGLRIPSIDELADTYEQIATKRMRNPLFGKPSEKSIYGALANFRRCVLASGLTGDRPVTELFDRNMVKQVFNTLGEQMKPISAWSMIVALKSVTATWTIEEYEAKGFDVTPPRLPAKPIQANAPQYRMLPAATREKIEKWYISLADSNDRTLHLAASMTYQLAVRPIDTGLLTAQNFVEDPTDGMTHIVYKPHKTQMSSGRVVDWPILPALWEEIREVAGERLDAGLPLIESVRATYTKLNASMRIAVPELGETSKAVYELRKLCVDTVRRTMGAGHAVAISGDRLDTIDKYYSDPYKMIGVKPIEIAPIRGAEPANQD